MGQPDPFDFSDFGPPKRPSAPTPPPVGPGGSAAAPLQGGDDFSTGFDPWANQPKTQPRPRQQDAFGQATTTATLATAGPPLKWFAVALVLAARQFPRLGYRAMLDPASFAGLGGLAALKWFAVAFVLAAAGVVLALMSAASGGGVLGIALAGWLLAGPMAIGALTLYTRVDTRRRSEAIYSAPRWAGTLYWAVLAVCLIGIALGAWQIALWAGRQ